jgi:hypothetical protein
MNGLKNLHDYGMVHYLKPCSIFLSEEGIYKLDISMCILFCIYLILFEGDWILSCVIDSYINPAIIENQFVMLIPV